MSPSERLLVTPIGRLKLVVGTASDGRSRLSSTLRRADPFRMEQEVTLE